MAVGSPATVLARLKPLIESTKADELMVTTMIFDHGARKHSYELLAQAFGLALSPAGRGSSIAKRNAMRASRLRDRGQAPAPTCASRLPARGE